MEKKVISQLVTTRTVNQEGKLVEESTVIRETFEKEPDYVKLYVKDILRLSEIPSSGNSILFAILRRMTYNHDIALFAPVKREISAELNLKEITISKAIELFTEKSILLRKDRGLYVINPFFFGRGKWEDIKKVRIEIMYSESGRMIFKALIQQKDSIQSFESKKVEVIDDKKQLELSKKKSELLKDLEALDSEMLKNTKTFKKVALYGE